MVLAGCASPAPAAEGEEPAEETVSETPSRRPRPGRNPAAQEQETPAPEPTEEAPAEKPAVTVGSNTPTGNFTPSSSGSSMSSLYPTPKKSGLISTNSNIKRYYTETAEQAKQSTAIAKKIADSIGKEGSDLERVQKATKKVYEYWIQCSYEDTQQINYIAYGVFVHKKSCCWGTAGALGLVLDYMGIPWERADYRYDPFSQNSPIWMGGMHQWCKVVMDGKVGWADAMVGCAYYGVFGEDHTCSYTDVVTKEPTCTATGVLHHQCNQLTLWGSRCGGYSDKIPALGHDFAKKETVPPTESSGGYTIYACKRCGQEQIRDYTDPLTHNYQKTVVPPTETQAGYTIYRCANCGNEYIWDYTPAQKSCEELGRSHQWHTFVDKNGQTTSCTLCGRSQ